MSAYTKNYNTDKHMLLEKYNRDCIDYANKVVSIMGVYEEDTRREIVNSIVSKQMDTLYGRSRIS